MELETDENADVVIGEDGLIESPEPVGIGTEEGYAADDAHSDVFPPFDTDTFAPQLVWLVISFAALYVLMSKVALPRIGDILDKRKARIDGDLAEAEAARQKTEAAVAEYEAALAEARAKSQALAEQTRESIRADIEQRRQAVEADLAGKLAAAETSVAGTKAAALANVDEIAAETTEALVARLTGEITPEQAREAVAAAKE